MVKSKYKKIRIKTNVHIMLNLLSSTNLGAIIDSVALIVILVFAVVGVVQGLTKSFVSSFGGIISIILAGLLCSSMAKFLESQHGLITNFANKLSTVTKGIFGDIVDVQIGEANENLLSEAGIALWLIKFIFSVKGDLPPTTTINTIICPIFAYYVTAIICLIVLYILFRLFFILLSKVISDLYVFKLVEATDRVLGLALGIFKGILVVQLVLLLINALPINFFQQISLSLNNAPFANFINNINIFDLIIKLLSKGNITEIISNIVAK